MTSRPEEDVQAGTSRFTLVAEGVIEAGWLVALVVVPLFFNVYSVRSYEPDKLAVFSSIVLAMAGAWLFKVLTGDRAFLPLGGLSHATTEAAGMARWVVRVVVISVGVLAAWIALTASLSIDVRVGWFGSYARSSGALMHLTYVAFFGLVAAHLRTPRQWERAAYAIVLAGATTAGFAVLQALDLDPLFPADKERVGAMLGNPIFLAAYLSMTVFITALVARGRIAARSVAPARRRATVGLWVIIAAGALQLAAILLSQSRGPLLGLLAGAYVVLLIAAVASRSGSDDRRHGSGPAVIWWATVIATGVVFVAFTWAAQSDSLRESLEDVPVVGRISSAFDIGATPGRQEIWRSVADRIGSTEPVQAPGRPSDTLATLRPLIGFGPDTLGLAVGRHVTDGLAAIEGVPDRSHNATFDAIAMQGFIGYALWVVLYGAIIALCLERTGLIARRSARRAMVAFVAAGAALGVLLPVLVTGEWALSGLGVAVGAVAGLASFVTIQTAPWRKHRPPSAGDHPGFWPLLAILGALLAHVIEIHFGILVASTRLMFWFFAAAVIVISLGNLTPTAASLPENAPAGSKRRRRGRSARARRASTDRATGWDRREAIVLGSLIAIALAPFSYSLMILRQGHWLRDVLYGSLGATAESGWNGPGAYLWIVVIVFLVGAALLGTMPPRSPKAKPVLWGLGVAAALAITYAIYQALRLTSVVTQQLTNVLAAAEYALNHFSWFLGLVVVSIAVVGTLLGWQRKPDPESRAPAWWRVAGAALVIVVAGAAVVISAFVAPIRADMLARAGLTFSDSNAHELAIESLDQATSLWPGEPRYWLLSGRVAFAAASGNPAESPELFDTTRGALEAAVLRGSLDPDHHANLARYWIDQADRTDNTTLARDLLEEADRRFSDALSLQPKSPILLRDHIALLLRLDRIADADVLAERLVRIESSR